ncbi:hypothetical protein PCE1_004013 [Barthelona sp. PCE]
MGLNSSIPQRTYYVERNGERVPFRPNIFQRLVLEGVRNQLREPAPEMGSVLPDCPPPVVQPVRKLVRRIMLNYLDITIRSEPDQIVIVCPFQADEEFIVEVLHHVKVTDSQLDGEQLTSFSVDSSSEKDSFDVRLSHSLLAEIRGLERPVFPFAIVLKTADGSQKEYTVFKFADTSAEVVGQYFYSGNQFYVLKDIYGNVNESSSKCCICFTNPVEIAVLPSQTPQQIMPDVQACN